MVTALTLGQLVLRNNLDSIIVKYNNVLKPSKYEKNARLNGPSFIVQTVLEEKNLPGSLSLPVSLALLCRVGTYKKDIVEAVKLLSLRPNGLKKLNSVFLNELFPPSILSDLQIRANSKYPSVAAEIFNTNALQDKIELYRPTTLSITLEDWQLWGTDFLGKVQKIQPTGGRINNESISSLTKFLEKASNNPFKIKAAMDSVLEWNTLAWFSLMANLPVAVALSYAYDVPHQPIHLWGCLNEPKKVTKVHGYYV